MTQDTKTGASSGPGSRPSDEAPAGLPAFGASIPRALWQPGEPVIRSEYVRVTYDDNGHLDEVVTDGGAHLEHMGGKNWWLACHRRDGSTFAVWFTGKITMTEEQEAPRVSDGSGEADETAGLGPKGNSAVAESQTPTIADIPVHSLCAEADGCILDEAHMSRCCGGDACTLLRETREAERAAYERAAKWHSDESEEAMGSLCCGSENGDFRVARQAARFHESCADAILALIPKEPT